MFYLVCFDIVDDRTRQRVVKVLKGYGHRVQKSVFECSKLSEDRYLKLKNKLEDLIDLTEDSIRYYPLCKGCVKNVEHTGIGEDPAPQDYKVV